MLEMSELKLNVFSSLVEFNLLDYCEFHFLKLLLFVFNQDIEERLFMMRENISFPDR